MYTNTLMDGWTEWMHGWSDGGMEGTGVRVQNPPATPRAHQQHHGTSNVDKLKLQNGACLSIWGGPTALPKSDGLETIDKPAFKWGKSSPHTTIYVYIYIEEHLNGKRSCGRGTKKYI